MDKVARPAALLEVLQTMLNGKNRLQDSHAMRICGMFSAILQQHHERQIQPLEDASAAATNSGQHEWFEGQQEAGLAHYSAEQGLKNQADCIRHADQKLNCVVDWLDE